MTNLAGRTLIPGLLCFFFVMGVWFITRNSATFDEPALYYAGYAYFERGDFAVNYHLPPLSKGIALLPIHLLSRLRLIATPHFATADENPAAGLDLLYRSPVSASAQLFLARVPMLLLGLLTILVIARWTYRLWGMPAAIVGTGLAATEPTLIAHSSVITPDIALACFFTLCFYLLWLYREDGSWRTFVWAGIAFGAALGSKFPALLVLPALGLIVAADASTGAWVVPWRRRIPAAERWHAYVEAALMLAVFCLIAGLTLVAIYAGYGIGFWRDGLMYQLGRSSQANVAFLGGQYSDHGWWYYFPVAFALKTPALTLGVIVASLALPRLGRPLRKPEVLFLIIPPLLFLAAMMAGRVNIGVRYILPVYPFLFILAARLVTLSPRPLVAGLLCVTIVWNAASTVWLAPHFLASANVIAGGPVGIARLLTDSNVDWGQGLTELKRYMDRERIPELYLAYFGTARPSDYGIRYQYIPSFGGEDTGHRLSSSSRQIVAISVTNLYGVYLVDHDLYAWLREKTPIATPGYAIYVYDLTGDPDVHCRLAEAYAAYREVQYQAIERSKCDRSARQPQNDGIPPSGT